MNVDAQPRPPDATHAGGVVYRERDGQVEYLLVRATGPLREWVLPKGHIEPGEGTRDAAVREVHEEAGVSARIVHELDTVEYTLREQRVRIRFYLMQAHEDAAGGSHEDREQAWLPIDEALQRLGFDTYRRLLTLAEQTLSGR